MSNPLVHDVVLHFHDIKVRTDVIESLRKFKEGCINVSELCTRLSDNGLQVLLIDRDEILLCVDMAKGIAKATISFKMRL